METAVWIKVYTFVQVVSMYGISGSIGYRDTTDKTMTNKIWNTNCPAECICYKGTPSLSINEMKYMNIVDCANLGLEKLKMILPDGTEVLLLSNNSLTQLTHLPNSSNLVYLDLSNSSIEILDNYVLFSHYTKLKFLNLSGNKLEYLWHSSFMGLADLYSLDLSNNRLSNISKRVFAGLNHLKSFNMADNLLREIVADWFTDISDDLRELDISHNLLTSINTDDFHALTNLNLLNLSANKINFIDNDAFLNLSYLLILDLSYNQMQIVPNDSLHVIKSLKKLTFNGNPTRKIRGGDFKSMNIVYISISYMPELIFIEKHSFQNLPYFVTLEAHDNQKLIHIDAQAFDNVPSLSTLYLHNNQLTALSPTLIEYIPSLEQIHLYHNPLRCDCNAFWIKRLTDEAAIHNYSKPLFNHSQFIKCNYPFNYIGVSIEDMDEKRFARVCTPTTLPVFKENYTLDLGEELRLECHAYGIPVPKLSWLLPNQTKVNGDIHSDKFEIVDDCVLIVRHLTIHDGGTYACIADNGIGVDLSSTRITVTNKPIRIVLLTVSFDYVSLSWNGTRHTSMISDYQLHYREITADNNQNSFSTKYKYKVIPLGPQYRSYTVTHLKSKTIYEFCIVYIYDTEPYKVDCKRLKTRDKVEYHNAVSKIVSEKIIAGVCTALGIIMAVACMVTLVKKFKLHKEYESPYNTDETESINIPLENVYRPSSTQLCSSKTSLLSVQTHKSGFEEY